MAALGARFDLKAFNDKVVPGGNVPLAVRVRSVDESMRTGWRNGHKTIIAPG